MELLVDKGGAMRELHFITVTLFCDCWQNEKFCSSPEDCLSGSMHLSTFGTVSDLLWGLATDAQHTGICIFMYS